MAYNYNCLLFLFQSVQCYDRDKERFGQFVKRRDRMAKTQKQHKKESAVKKAFRIVMILIGAACAAASIELFLVPNNIIDGGIIGISLILDYLFKDKIGRASCRERV